MSVYRLTARSKWVLITILICISSTHSMPSFIRHEGSKCKVRDGGPGVCKFITQCPEVKCARRNRMQYERCTMEGRREVVCCKPERPSVRECKEYRMQRDKMFFIMNGKPAEEYEFPHMAALGYLERNTGDMSWNCGGALISDQYVLTAAHCINNRKWGNPVKVRLGKLDLNEEPTGREAKYLTDFNVEEVIVHKGYNRSANYNDIALLKLSPLVAFTKSIFPACLYTEATLKAKQILTVTGWGTIDVKGIIPSTILRKAYLTEENWDTCMKLATQFQSTSLPRGLDSKMLCASSTKLLGSGDSCKGDSGGPLQFQEDSASLLYSIVGVTSFGFDNKCGGEKPGIYTKVSEYLDWIECIVWREY